MSNRFQIIFAVTVILFSVNSLYAASTGNSAAWAVRDLTGTLELSAVDENNPMWTLSLRNKSTSVITAVALSFRTNAHYYQDWLNAEPPGLAPGQTFDVTVSAEDGASRKINLSAVLFEDGGGKGDSDQLEIMNCHRFGQILESSRIKDILLNRDSSNNDSSIDVLSQKVGKLPLSAEDAFLSLAAVGVPGIRLNSLKQSGEKARNAVLWGVSTTRERALRQIETVRQMPALSADGKVPSRSEIFTILQEQYEAQNKKALSLLTRMQGGR